MKEMGEDTSQYTRLARRGGVELDVLCFEKGALQLPCICRFATAGAGDAGFRRSTATSTVAIFRSDIS